ncbi:hypothetical protein F1D05_04900 [Kribbella qitaiheensis]|uniref:Uncharacterized protein n=1 Tax=Kribbella qitaiheensis TaxID=1544730 RepID=A0A7G6WTR3_9ACTN|nr:hypothetical protein [Kribbella qitaiheensis]QNE17378.1 hypothetical protein F1D05_04900 [Kribbella qitaiheensis]
MSVRDQVAGPRRDYHCLAGDTGHPKSARSRPRRADRLGRNSPPAEPIGAGSHLGRAPKAKWLAFAPGIGGYLALRGAPAKAKWLAFAPGIGGYLALRGAPAKAKWLAFAPGIGGYLALRGVRVVVDR